MATFAVCMSAQEGSKIVWSLVASIDLNGTFVTLFDRYNNDRYNFASAHVAVSPSGPWQDVGNDETLDVLSSKIKCSLANMTLFLCLCSLIVFVLNQMWDELTHPLFAMLKKKKKKKSTYRPSSFL